MALFVLILYDHRDDVRRAEVLTSETEAGAIEQAHQIVNTSGAYNGYDLWHAGKKVASHFLKPRHSRPLMPPDGQQGSHHLRLRPSHVQFG